MQGQMLLGSSASHTSQAFAKMSDLPWIPQLFAAQCRLFEAANRSNTRTRAPPRVPQVSDWSTYEKEISIPTRVNFESHLLPFLITNRSLKRTAPGGRFEDEIYFVTELIRDLHAADVLDSSWKQTTAALMDTIDYTFASIVTQLFWKDPASSIWGHLSVGDFNSETDIPNADAAETPVLETNMSGPNTHEIDTIESLGPISDEDIHTGLTILHTCYYRAYKYPVWEELCKLIQELCRAVGTPCSSFTNPIGSVEAIRHYYAYQAPDKQDELRKQYNELRDKFEEQKRVKTCLTFRHILENLPGPRPNPRFPSTAH
ncbi:hypothetical protein DL98DRAFT_246717 [Cadophora sp. DSE1049]|nr:hypothetical protein DL98DRAFT_246717 [Cadophora sp. DSE1049]